jgi:hypothetical protein
MKNRVKTGFFGGLALENLPLCHGKNGAHRQLTSSITAAPTKWPRFPAIRRIQEFSLFPNALRRELGITKRYSVQRVCFADGTTQTELHGSRARIRNLARLFFAPLLSTARSPIPQC